MPQLFDFDDIDLNFDPDRFTDELIAGAEIDDAAKEALRSIVKHPTIGGRLKNVVTLRSKAQSALDKTRNIAREAETIRDANFKWAADNKPALEAWLASERGGNPSATVQAPSGDYLTRAELAEMLAAERRKAESMLASQDESYVGVLADTVDLMQEWSSQFPGERFPYADLQKYALTNRMSLRTAFKDYIEPKMEEKRKTDIERIKADAYEQGKLEGLSQREEVAAAGEGGDLGSAFKDVLLGRRTQTLTTGDGKQLKGEDAFVADWNSTRGFTVPQGTKGPH
jgi:hypothetical protein